MTTWIDVTTEQVDAAKLHVEAYRSAGLNPDPIIAALAETEVPEARWESLPEVPMLAGQDNLLWRRELAADLRIQLQLSRQVIDNVVATFGAPDDESLSPSSVDRAIDRVRDIHQSAGAMLRSLASQSHGVELYDDLEAEVASLNERASRAFEQLEQRRKQLEGKQLEEARTGDRSTADEGQLSFRLEVITVSPQLSGARHRLPKSLRQSGRVKFDPEQRSILVRLETGEKLDKAQIQELFQMMSEEGWTAKA